MTLVSIGRRVLLALTFGLAVWLAGPPGALAQKLPPYAAAAGMLKTGPDPERPDAEIFHVAYTLKGADPATRPVTFVFNGGPGAASIYLHLAAIGPKTIVTAGQIKRFGTGQMIFFKGDPCSGMFVLIGG